MMENLKEKHFLDAEEVNKNRWMRLKMFPTVEKPLEQVNMI